MKWIIKASASAALSRIPGGRTVYHKLQRACGTNRLDVEESLKRSVEIVDLIRGAGGQIENAVCVEIGTGWRPFLPIILRLAGAKRILTFDINPWLDAGYVKETIAAIGSHLREVAESLQVSEKEVRRRFEPSTRSGAEPSHRTLDRLLDPFHIEYRCPGDASRTGLGDGTVDCIVSSNVLEHIPPQVLQAIHGESRRILRPSGVIAHRFNPEDHFVAVDSSITSANFLKFSKRQWYWLGGSGLAYHNRLRCIEHRRLVEHAGFHIVTECVRLDERAREFIRTGKLTVHSDFAQWDADELAADYMWLAARPGPLCENTSFPRHAVLDVRSARHKASSERICPHELV